MQNQDIIITTTDQQRLLPVLDQYDSSASEALRDEIYRAVILDPHAVPADVVTMNSEVVYEDGHTGAQRRVKLVYPQDADASRGHVSVLAPIGTALLGLRVGQTIEWVVPHGTKKIRVLEIPYQPEAAGAFGL